MPSGADPDALGALRGRREAGIGTMKIVVTGAAGQLGGELCRLWADQATGLDRARCDVKDASRVRRLMAELRPDVVVHSAGYTQVDRAEIEPHECLAVNSDAVASLADVCNE